MEASKPMIDIQKVAITFAAISSALSVIVFFMCRAYPNMQMLALGNILGQITQLTAIASTLLVGKSHVGDTTQLNLNDPK